MHVGEVELLLALCLIYLIVLRTEELPHLLRGAPVQVLLWSHHNGCSNPLLANLRTDDVAVERVVILHLLLHVLGSLQVGGVLLQVVVGDGSGALNLPAGVQQ